MFVLRKFCKTAFENKTVRLSFDDRRRPFMFFIALFHWAKGKYFIAAETFRGKVVTNAVPSRESRCWGQEWGKGELGGVILGREGRGFRGSHPVSQFGAQEIPMKVEDQKANWGIPEVDSVDFSIFLSFPVSGKRNLRKCLLLAW